MQHANPVGRMHSSWMQNSEIWFLEQRNPPHSLIPSSVSPAVLDLLTLITLIMSDTVFYLLLRECEVWEWCGQIQGHDWQVTRLIGSCSQRFREEIRSNPWGPQGEEWSKTIKLMASPQVLPVSLYSQKRFFVTLLQYTLFFLKEFINMEKNVSGFYFFILFIFKVLWLKIKKKKEVSWRIIESGYKPLNHSPTTVDLRKYVHLQTSFSYFSLK